MPVKYLASSKACQTWSSLTVNNTFRRMGHALVARGRDLLVIGGSDGILSNDIVTMAIPAQTDAGIKSRDSCKGILTKC